MPRYSVHARSPRPEVIRAEADRIRFVKEGFSWWGFLFPLPWLLFKGMWEVLVLTIIVLIAIVIVGTAFELPELVVLILCFGINLVMGFIGNDLYRWTLARRGLPDVGPATGSDLDEAELRYFLALPPSPLPAPSVVAAPTRPEARDALGLFEAAGSAR